VHRTIHHVSIVTILALGLCLLALVLVVRLAPGAIRSWQIYAGTKHRHQEDAGARAPAIPRGVADRLAILAEAGYESIGVTRLELPVGARFAWIVAAADGGSYAILAGGLEGVPMTGIYSAWTDGTWLGTMHPRGTPLDRGGLQIRVVPTTLDATVAEHRLGLARLRPSTAIRAPSGPWRTCWRATWITGSDSVAGPSAR
jgi:hypothetical protein